MGMDVAGMGYLAVPESGQGPGLLVLHEWLGLVPHIKSVADRFAAAGYVALAPDLYEGKLASSPDEASAMMMGLNTDKTTQKLQKAADFLQSHEAVVGSHLGVIGFCMGGQLALLTGTVSPHIGAVIDFYGIHPNVTPDFSNLNGPILGIFAEQDAFVSPEAVKALEVAVHQAGKSLEAHTYPGTSHAFFNDTRPDSYDPDAAADAWKKAIAFLQHTLTA